MTALLRLVRVWGPRLWPMLLPLAKRTLEDPRRRAAAQARATSLLRRVRSVGPTSLATRVDEVRAECSAALAAAPPEERDWWQARVDRLEALRRKHSLTRAMAKDDAARARQEVTHELDQLVAEVVTGPPPAASG